MSPSLLLEGMRYRTDSIELSLEEMKTHLRVDYEEDDLYIERLGKTAVSHIVNATHRSVEELTEMNGGIFPVELMQAALQLVDLWYKERSAVSSISKVAVPYGLEMLIKPFTKLTR